MLLYIGEMRLAVAFKADDGAVLMGVADEFRFKKTFLNENLDNGRYGIIVWLWFGKLLNYVAYESDLKSPHNLHNLIFCLSKLFHGRY